MADDQEQSESSLLARGDEPLIGVFSEEEGNEVVRYFAEEESALATYLSPSSPMPSSTAVPISGVGFVLPAVRA